MLFRLFKYQTAETVLLAAFHFPCRGRGEASGIEWFSLSLLPEQS